MSFGKRLSRIIRSNVNDMLSAAEDPEKQLDLLLSEMEDALRQAKQHLIRALTDEKRLQRQLDETDDLVKLWHEKAQQAVDAGKDDLARDALRKKRTYEDLATEYDGQLAEQQRAVDQLREQYKLLEQRLKEARERRHSLRAELYRRQAQGRIESRRPGTRRVDTSSLTERSAFDKFDEMADKIIDLEAQTQASRELEDYLDDRELADQIDRESGRTTPRTTRIRDDESLRVDIELEEMRKRAGREGAATTGRRSRRRDAEPPPEVTRPAPDEPPGPEGEKPEEPPPDDDEGGWGRRVEL